MSDLDKIKTQHVNNYRNAIIEIITNNTNSLVDNDINSLVKKPPLDSMDQIKSKFLSIAKKEKIILKTNELNNIVDKFREDVVTSFNQVKDIRIKNLTDNINKVDLNDDNNVIKITKKELSVINKLIKKNIKESLNSSIDNNIMKNIPLIFDKDIDKVIFEKINKEVIKFLGIKGIYRKQLLENIDFKILVKDTTLINGVREQGDRYIFTKNNSHLFN